MITVDDFGRRLGAAVSSAMCSSSARPVPSVPAPAVAMASSDGSPAAVSSSPFFRSSAAVLGCPSVVPLLSERRCLPSATPSCFCRPAAVRCSPADRRGNTMEDCRPRNHADQFR